MRSLYRKLILPLAAIAALGSASCGGNSDEEILRKEREESGSGVVGPRNSYLPELESSLPGIDLPNLEEEPISVFGEIPMEPFSLVSEPTAEEKPIVPETVVTAPAIVNQSPKVTWTYNPNYSFDEIDGLRDGRVDFFKVQRGNPIHGGIEALARNANTRLTSAQITDLVDDVMIFRNGREVSIRPEQLRPGDAVYFSNAIQDAVYGRKLEQKVEADATPTVVPIRELTTMDLNGDNVLDYADFNLFLDRYSQDPDANVNDFDKDSDPVGILDYFGFVDKFGEAGKISQDREDGFNDSFISTYESWKALSAKDKEATPRRNLLSAYKLSTGSFDGGASYDRLFDNGFGLGAEAGRSNDNLRLLGRLSYGNDDFRAGVGLGHTYVDGKKSITGGPYFQFQVPHFATDRVYGEVGADIWDVGEWRRQVMENGNGNDATRDYGEARVGIGVRF